VALARLRALAAHADPGVTVIGGDVHNTATVLASEEANKGFGFWASAIEVRNHSVAGFTNLELVPPRVVDSRAGRPDWDQPVQLPPG